MTPLTDDELAAIEARATEPSQNEPWYASGRGIFRRAEGMKLASTAASIEWIEDTNRFIELLNRGESARTDVPALIAEVRRLRRDIAEANASPIAQVLAEHQSIIVRVTLERDEARAQLEAAKRRGDRYARFVRAYNAFGVHPWTDELEVEYDAALAGARAALAETDAEKKGEGRW